MLKIKNYNFTYDEKIVFKNASLNIHNGVCVGIVGVNGCGKTTLLLSLAGLNRPNDASITYNQQSISENLYYQRHVVYLSEEIIDDNYTMASYLKRLRKIYSKEVNWAVYDFLVSSLSLNTTQVMSDMTKGKRRLAYLTCFMALQPKVVILDEYLDGIDILSSNTLKSFLIDYKKKYEAIIIVSSHSSDDIKDMCDYLSYVDSFALTKLIPVNELTSRYNVYKLNSDTVLERDDFIKKGIFVKDFKQEGNTYYISFENNQETIDLLHQHFKDVTKIPSDLGEAIFYELVS